MGSDGGWELDRFTSTSSCLGGAVLMLRLITLGSSDGRRLIWRLFGLVEFGSDPVLFEGLSERWIFGAYATIQLHKHCFNRYENVFFTVHE